MRKFCKHENPEVRAAAIAGLSTVVPKDVQQEMQALLADSEAVVRIAAGKALFQILQTRRRQSPDVKVSIKAQPKPATTISGISQIIERVSDLFQKKATTAPAKKPSKDKKKPDDNTAEKGSNNKEPRKDNQQPNDDNKKTTDDAAAPKDNKKAAGKDSQNGSKDNGTDKVHPKWMYELVDLLTKLLQGETAEEQLAGAMPLAALGKTQLTLPIVHAVIKSDPQLRSLIAKLLPLLEWDDRVDLFNRLIASTSNVGDISIIATSMATTQDTRAQVPLWNLLSDEQANARLARAVSEGIKRLYFQNNYYDPTQAPLSSRNNAIADVTPRAKSGSVWQRLAALSILLQIARDDAAAISKTIVDDTNADAPFRAQAFRILLAAESRTQGTKTAIAGLSSKVPRIPKLSLSYLVAGKKQIANLPDDEFSLNVDSNYRSTSGKAIFPEAPTGLTAEAVRPLSSSEDPQTAAYAQYLLVLLDEPNSLPPLIAYWEKRAKADPSWTRLVYRAIAFLDEASYVPLLENMYEKQYRQQEQYEYDVSEFYWTIRIMTGPKTLALRKRIREEIGVDQLR